MYIRIRGKTRRLSVIFDEVDAKKYKNSRLHYSKSHGVYRLKNSKKCLVAREILELTDPWARVNFASPNKLDMRKHNLNVYTVPPARRGKYCVHIPANTSN